MSRYGIDFYGGSTVYGEIPLIEFDARPVTALAKNYGELQLRWHSPSGNWDRLRLTRDTYGFAPRADMGQVLLDVPATTPVTEFTDTQGIIQGRFYYYTVWVRDITVPTIPLWKRAGDVIGLAVQNWGHSAKMFELVPEIYRDKDALTSDTYHTGRGQLERFLDIPGFQGDHIRTEYETLKWVNDPDKVSGGLLPLMARQLGFGYEAELGMRLARSQMRNAVHIYKHKGAQIGVEALASVLTGWDPTVTVGRNLALNQDDSSVQNGTGGWTNVSNATISRRSTTDASAPGAITGPVGAPPGASTGDIGSGDWMLLLTAIGAGDVVVQSFPTGTAYDNRTLSIPVKDGLPYTFSIYGQALDTARSVQIGVEWFNLAGTSLGAVTQNTAVSNGLSAWTRNVYTVTSPTHATDPLQRAAYVRVTLRELSAVAGNRMAFDALQVEQASSAGAYQSARSIRISFAPDRLNLVPNGGAEVDVAGWTAVGTTAFVKDTAQFHSGVAAFKATASGGNMSFTTTTGTGGMAVIPLRYYTASFYDFKPSGTVRQIRVDVIWYTAAGAIISTVLGTAVNQTIGAWSRASVTALAPATAATAAVVVNILVAGAAEIHWFDSVLMETGTNLFDYFDGSTPSNEGEYMWSAGGTPGATKSYFYSRRLIKNYRLNTRLKEFLPAGSTYALLYAGQT